MNKKRASHQNFEVLFEDGDFIVINKPVGILSVPFAGSRSPNVLELVADYLASKRQKPLVVHRIDRFTSGILVFAKHYRAKDYLVKQFMAHTPVREYFALVRGVLKPQSGSLVHHFKLSKNGFRQMVVRKNSPGSTEARLDYRTLEAGVDASLISVRLDTGLKNQIRVQFAAIDHPIVGDRHYRPEEAELQELDHQALHAGYLAFKKPANGKLVEFKSKPPRDFIDVTRKLGIKFEFPSTVKS